MKLIVGLTNALHTVFVLSNFVQCQAQDCATPMFERYFGYTLQSELNSLIYKNFTFTTSMDMINSCRKTCSVDVKCQGFDVDFKKLLCSWYQAIPERNVKFFQTQLTQHSDGAFFKKTCFNSKKSLNYNFAQCGPNERTFSVRCSNKVKIILDTINCTYLWQFDHLPRTTVKFNQTQTQTQFRSVQSLEQCQEMCLNEIKFQCRSAQYNVQTKSCHLNHNDRRTMPNLITNGKSEELYIENQCGLDLVTSCAFSQDHGQAMAFALIAQPAQNKMHCEKSCVDSDKFVCRSYHYDTSAKLCKFGTDDSFSIDTVQNSSATSSAYFQRDECTDVKVNCDGNRMTATFRLDRQFDGKIFSLKQPNQCLYDLKNQFVFNISMSLDQKEFCGIVTEVIMNHNHIDPSTKSVVFHEDGDANTLSTMMVMQFHDSVKTSRDKTLKVVCKFDLSGQTVQSFVEVNETTGAHSTALVTGGGPLPEAIMRIVNGEGQTVTTAEVGQILYAEVVLRDANGTSGGPFDYGLFVTGCEAFDEGQKVVLIDQFGCPIDTALFEAFYPVAGSDNRILRAAFQGFRFQTKKRVNINCNVNFCFRFCQPNLCTDHNGRRVMSYGKKRKRKRASIGDRNDVVGSATVKSTIIFDEPELLVLEERSSLIGTHNATIEQKSMSSIKNIDSIMLPLIVSFSTILLIILTLLAVKFFGLKRINES